MPGTDTEGKSARPAALHLHATGSACDLQAHEENERRLVEAAKWEQADVTSACRRCLRVATDTNEVAASTLGELYRQGKQADRAAHGVEQIDQNVKHAGRMLRYMSRLCCFRNTCADPDLQMETRYRTGEVERQRRERALAAEGIAAAYASKHQLAGQAAAHAQERASAADDAAKAAAAAVASAAAGDGAQQDSLIAAVPGQRQQLSAGLAHLGAGLAPADQRCLQAEAAAQEAYLGCVGEAVDALKAISLAMAQEMEEQAPRLEALQLRAEDTEAGLRGAARGTAKLAGSAPRRSAATTADQAAAQAAARLRAAAAPVQ